MTGARLAWAGFLGLAAAATGQSISGPAPVGAAGRAPVGASGPAPVHGTGTIISGTPSGPLGPGYHPAFTNPYGGSYRNAGSYRNGSGRGSATRGDDDRWSYGRSRHGAIAVAPFFYSEVIPDNPYLEQGPTAEDQHEHVRSEELLTDEVRRLNREVSDLRESVRASQRSAENRPAVPVATPEPEAAAEPASPPVTVVLGDGSRFESTSYAVMDGMFWDFSASPVKRVPMSAINIAASVQASAAAGSEFPQ